MFDNRTLMTKAGLGGIQKRLDDRKGQGRNHFILQVGSKRLGYCYIRKNACSSFKRLFLDFSPAENQRRQEDRPIDFMRRHHCMAEKDFARCDNVIFVYRDPIERIMSMFRNKFIAEAGAVDIVRNFEKTEQQTADSMTFRSFVEVYLHRDFKDLDRHVLPQAVHLRRAIYTDVLPIKELYSGMSRILGTEIGKKYFQQPVNRTSDVAFCQVPDASELGLHEIRRLFVEHGFMPDDNSLLPADLKATLTARYSMDYDIIGRLNDN